jgi:hypothetical protein
MAIYSKVLELISGVARTVDLSTNTLSVQGLQINAATGGGSITQAAHATTTTYSIVWPAAQAAGSNYVLANDGAGTLSWIASATGSVTAVTASGALSSSGGSTPNITLNSNGVTNAFLAQMGANTIKGNNTGSPANALDLTATQVTAMLNQFSSSLQGLVPASGGGTTNFLRADGTWTPAGTGSVTSVAFSDASTTPIYTITGSPVTSSGTLTQTLIAQTAATVFAGPATGSAAQPTFRTLVATDIPSLSATYVTQSEVGAANGVAGLDGAGKVPYSQLPSALMTFKGAWNPTDAVNTLTALDPTPIAGDVYRASVGGVAVTGNGAVTGTQFYAGDFAIYSGSAWERSPLADGVISVNGLTGAVTVNAINQLTGDGTAGPASGSASAAFTLATVNSNVGTFTNSTITVNAKGLITAASSGPSSSAGVTLTSVAGQNFSSTNTTYAVRWGITANSETTTRLYACDTTTSSFDLFYCIGTLTVGGSTITTGTAITVTRLGGITLGSSDPAFTLVGQPVYMGASGVLTQTAPSSSGTAITRVGILSSTTTVDVNPVPVGVN